MQATREGADTEQNRSPSCRVSASKNKIDRRVLGLRIRCEQALHLSAYIGIHQDKVLRLPAKNPAFSRITSRGLLSAMNFPEHAGNTVLSAQRPKLRDKDVSKSVQLNSTQIVRTSHAVYLSLPATEPALSGMESGTAPYAKEGAHLEEGHRGRFSKAVPLEPLGIAKRIP